MMLQGQYSGVVVVLRYSTQQLFMDHNIQERKGRTNIEKGQRLNSRVKGVGAD